MYRGRRRHETMGDIISMRAVAGKDECRAPNQLEQSSREGSSAPAGPPVKGQIVVLDTTIKDLLLLQYRGRKLDELKLAIYKGSTTVNVPGKSGNVEVAVRVLVKSRLVEYYFYCPKFGNKIRGSIDCRADFGTDCIGLSWQKVQEMVRSHILTKMRNALRGSRVSRNVSHPAESNGYSDQRLSDAAIEEGGSSHDSHEDSLLHRLFRKFGVRW
jgi:hypothetical protein